MYNMFTFNMLLLSIITLGLVSSIDSALQARESVGVLFKEVEPPIRRVLTYKYVNFILKVPDFKTITDTPRGALDYFNCTAIKEFSNECEFAKHSLHIETLQKHTLTKSYNAKIEIIKNTLRSMTLSTASKRALINISNLLSNVFGTATQEEVNDIKKQINNLIMNIDNNNHNVKSFYDAIKALKNTTNANAVTFNNYIDRNNNIVMNLQNRINNITKQFGTFYNDYLFNFQVYYSAVRTVNQLFNTNMRIISHNIALTTAINTADSFIESLMTLNRHQIPTTFIKYTDLHKALSSLRNQLTKSGLVDFAIDTNAEYYYAHAQAHAFSHKDVLTISVKVPIFHHSHHFRTFILQTYEIPIHSASNQNSNKSMLINDPPYAIALSHNENKYGFLTQAELI